MPRSVFSYIVTHDTGFAPNPFWGYCTLACCKPTIRRTARPGDWVVGLAPRSGECRIIYAMEIAETLPYDRYYRDDRFRAKRPDFHGGIVGKCGDNIYRPLPGGGFAQLRSMHSKGAMEDLKGKEHDLKGRGALIAKRFWYFGSRAVDLPNSLSWLMVGRGHRRCRGADAVAALEQFLARHQAGVRAAPSKWRADDASWKESHRCG